MRATVTGCSRSWLAICALLIQASGCQISRDGDRTVSVTSGALGVQLNCGSLQIASVDYAITQAGQPYRTGTFAVDGVGSNFSALIALLDPGDGYAITLDALASGVGYVRAGTTPCTGSADFSIALAETTAVAVTLICDAGGDGNLADDRSCPGLENVRALPAAAPIGKCVRLEAVADAIALRSSKVAYQWSASSGQLQDVQGDAANFYCTEPGVAAVSIEVHGDDPLCAQRFPLYVTCRNSLDGSTLGSAAGSGGSPRPGH